MAEEIIIKIQGSSSSAAAKNRNQNKNEDGTIDLKKFLHPIKTEENKFNEAHPFGFYIYREIKRDISQLANTSFNRYTTLSEDYKANQRYLNISNIVSKSTGLLESIYVGATIGSVAGPIGTVIGATVGAIGQIASQTINHYDKLSDYYMQLNMNDYRTEFGRVRLGLIDGGRGTEN